MEENHQYILGIKFFTGELGPLLKLCQGRFVVVPSAPALVEAATRPALREALEKSDLAVTDSGYMVMLWRLYTGQRLRRISGLELLQGLLAGPDLKQPGASFWIMPSVAERDANLAWFAHHGYPVTADDCYLAPMYPPGPLTDETLLRLIEERRPAYVITGIGGGVQERLGYYLRCRLSYRPAIICIGAAIAFITGLQAHIPPWADRLWLGWLLRCLKAPATFIPRYRRAFRLAFILAKYRERSMAG